jgi:hypothetical protein
VYQWTEAPPSQLLKPRHSIPVALETIAVAFQIIYPAMDAMHSAILMACRSRRGPPSSCYGGMRERIHDTML